MLKMRLNLRKVAIIFACLAVTTMFAACDNKNGDDEDGDGTQSGKIDQKLIGIWNYSPDNETYKFSANGSFNHFSLLSATEGKFTTSDNKVHFSNIIYEKGETWEKHYPDAVYEYEVGKDNDGDYLKISLFLYGVTNVKLPTGYKFRKQK
jgi:hypothetical protein